MYCVCVLLPSLPAYQKCVGRMHETEGGYFGIPDDILDGIHPEESIDIVKDDTVEVDDVCLNINMGEGQDVGYQDEREVKLNLGLENLTQEKTEKKKWIINLEINAVMNFLLSYANYHMSSLFIIVLSLASLVCPGYHSVVITVIIIVVITALDHHYKIGIGNVL
eukprot:GFUD01006111.1.p1 GENE.GFUD01006111.1~~GFUD01006111.1.p1  ORF type:complete len:165 (+),score=25.18 GFUD01006111.1:53-547(+)